MTRVVFAAFFLSLALAEISFGAEKSLIGKISDRFRGVYQSELVEEQYHKVERGDSLRKIARKYGTTVKELVRINGILKSMTMNVGEYIYLPDVSTPDGRNEGPVLAEINEIRIEHERRISEDDDKPEGAAKKTPTQKQYHMVKKGDTLGHIARGHGTTVMELRRLNGFFKTMTLSVGQKILLPDGVEPVKKETAVVAKVEPVEPEEETPNADKQKKEKQKVGKAKKEERKQTANPAMGSAAYIWPIDKVDISSSFGRRFRGAGLRLFKFHSGLDLSRPKGSPIFAAAAGEVIRSGKWISAYGKTVMIRHSDGLVSVYAHNLTNLVKKGDKVKQGDVIARIGKSGRASGYHVHFEIRVNDKPVNPLKFLPKKQS